MHKPKNVVIVALLMCIVIISVGSVMAKQQPENGDANGDPDRLRDCSCIVPVADNLQAHAHAANINKISTVLKVHNSYYGIITHSFFLI